jgi:hypothetical protein
VRPRHFPLGCPKPSDKPSDAHRNAHQSEACQKERPAAHPQFPAGKLATSEPGILNEGLKPRLDTVQNGTANQESNSQNQDANGRTGCRGDHADTLRERHLQDALPGPQRPTTVVLVSAGFITAWVVFALLALVTNVGALSIVRQQRSEKVVAPDGHKYRVVLSSKGFPWIAWTNFDGSWLVGGICAVARIRQQKSWTIAVKDASDWRRTRSPAMRTETVSDWASARSRFDDVVSETEVVGIPPGR